MLMDIFREMVKNIKQIMPTLKAINKSIKILKNSTLMNFLRQSIT